MTALPAPEWGDDPGPAPIAPTAGAMSVALSALSATEAAQSAFGPTAGSPTSCRCRLTVHQRESHEVAVIGTIESRILALRPARRRSWSGQDRRSV